MFIKNALNAVFDAIVRNGAASGMNELEFLEEELKRWMGSKERLDMKTGLAYYSDHQDIERKNRRALGLTGTLSMSTTFRILKSWIINTGFWWTRRTTIF